MPSSFDRIVVLDFEATCQPGTPPSPQEIIEFPSVIVSLRDRAVEDTFSTFVRPLHHPTLSAFCTELTTIRQQDVDAAPPFLDVLAAHQAWLAGHGLLDAGGPERFAFVTCGDWDLQTMLPVQCAAAGLPVTALPRVYRRWINIKKVFLDSMKKAKTTGMPAMLQALDLELVGTHHRGIDDCHNIARIALALAERGAKFAITGKLAASHYPELPLELQWGDRVERAFLKKRHLASLLGLASGLFHTRMVRAFLADGPEITDDDPLAELAPDARIRLVSARDRPAT
ncbi:3'-5' exonuclease [Nannocystis pusilla]|uniref:Exonuclease domain-containing protein n=1 Tax=Nannocystis pusilla TaxID=889268 RepID=A0ABS7TZW9_9BACT|nr:3'-5' exonuclease [Nannocystis pusilla]MBZ5713763.1 exonuclease domain-containing protein [Nannocystis pusilla]